MTRRPAPIPARPGRALALGLLCAALAAPLTAQTRTDATFVAKLYGATLATITMAGQTSGSAYSVRAELSTRGIVSALSNTSYRGDASGRISSGRFRPARYDETVVEGSDRKVGALVWRAGLPQPEGYMAEERQDDALPISGQGDTVDPLTAIFMVLRDQSPEEVCPPLRQFVFDGERRSVVELTRTSETADTITCAGQFRRVAGYPKDEYDKRRKVFPLELTYTRSGDVMQAQVMKLRTDYGPATLERR